MLFSLYIICMKIANIYTTTKFENELYNVTDKKESLTEGIPTLIIGWSNTKHLFPSADILNWKIDDNTYWTFGKRERRSEYEDRLNKFFELSIEKLDKCVVYNYVNLLTATKEEKNALFNKITNGSRKSVLKYYDMLYITEEDYNVVYGISLRDVDYEGKNRNRIIDLVKKNTSIVYIEEDECSVCNDIISKMKNKVYLSTRIFV